MESYYCQSIHSTALGKKEAEVNKTIRIFNTPIGLIVVIALKSKRQPELPLSAPPAASGWWQPKPMPRPVTLGNLDDFIKNGVIKCR